MPVHIFNIKQYHASQVFFIRSEAELNSGQLNFKYFFSKLFESKRLLKYDTYMES